MNVRPIMMMEEMVKVLLDEYNVDAIEKTRKEAVVIPRAALFNVCRGYYSATTLGKYFGKNHATILHHFKNHDALMLVPQYRESFNALTDILTKYDERARLNKETAESIIEFLRTENESLKQKLQAYEETNS